LGGEKNLLFLAVKRFNDVLLLHISGMTIKKYFGYQFINFMGIIIIPAVPLQRPSIPRAALF
jgi:hypothetical protein